jgi:hypothetical protein
VRETTQTDRERERAKERERETERRRDRQTLAPREAERPDRETIATPLVLMASPWWLVAGGW